MGDVHFWSVWKGGWLEEYTEAKNIGRFMSEYGFQSYPEMRTIRRFASEHDLRLDSEVMLSHQRICIYEPVFAGGGGEDWN